MELLPWIVVALAGVGLGRIVLPGDTFADGSTGIVIGVFGAVVSGVIATTFGVGAGPDLVIVVPAALGAIVILLAYRTLARLALD